MSVQFYGYNFEGTGVFHFFAFMHSFQKLAVQILADFETLMCCRKKTLRTHYMQMSVNE